MGEVVDHCTSPTVAIDRLTKWGKTGMFPKLVLLDIKMPIMDGFEVLRWIRSDEALRDVFVVMLSSSEQSVDLSAAHDAGADSYLVKYPATGVLGTLLGLSLSAVARVDFAADLKRLGFASCLDLQWKQPHHLGSGRKSGSRIST